MQDLINRMQKCSQTNLDLLEHLDLPVKQIELQKLEKKSENPDLWLNNEKAQILMKKLSDLRTELEGWEKFRSRIENALELAEFNDEGLRSDLEPEIEQIESDLAQRELDTLLSGRFDKGNAFLAIHAGAGGTDSQDWAAMLQRMYLRWAEKRKFSTEILDQTMGEEAGIKSVTIAVNGDYAYGYLQSEKGVHRLVRLSPFDSNSRRHTSFVLVEILPEVSSHNPDIKINPDEVRIDVFRSSGAGGQNVQKNATAVRLTHLPSGLVVTCQNERSQVQNRENAMRVLRARLLEIQRQKQNEHIAELKGEFTKAEWGSQIRSYVLHPYQMVKDHRTEYEEGNSQSVLDGNIDAFIEAFLKM
ncbi:MAG: peptide chain release factor 2 [Anaerolineaceae bacterium]|nr:peptide chain release factor 2 [Anaerolineaceae bacterium]